MSDDFRNSYREGQKQFLWTLPRVLGAVFLTIVAIYILMVLLTPLTIGLGWYKGEANLRSFPHVEETYREAYDDVNSMEANVRQTCRYKKLVTEAKNSGESVTVNQRETQLTAVENNYDRIKGEYEAYMKDHFRGGLIHPSSLPLPYPSIEERIQIVCK